MLKSVLITPPEKTGEIESELHRTSSIMSQVKKIILRMEMMRV